MDSKLLQPQQQKTTWNSNVALTIVIFLLCLVSMSNIIIYHQFSSTDKILVKRSEFPNSVGKAMISFVSQPEISAPVEHEIIPQLRQPKEKKGAKDTEEHMLISNNGEHHPIAGLSCADHGGPADDIASEMIFWSDIESDSVYKSTFYDVEKYITFEPDQGGWNNIRMAYETILVLAHAMGRTLVLPPESKMYLLGKGGNEHKKDFTFNDFFHLDSIAMEHEGLSIITMEDFLKRKGLTNQLKDQKNGKAIRPPNDKTNWNGEKLTDLWAYLRSVGKYPEGWTPHECIAAIPSSKDPQDVIDLQKMFDDIQAGKHGKIPDAMKDFIDEPVPVDGPVVDRLREMLASRKRICIYDNALQDEELIHFKVDRKASARMLTHFYAFAFFQDWKQDLWSKRFVRDHIRYVDEIVCAAARIVNGVRERARTHDDKNTGGEYDSFHVRRGDFQYKGVKVEADVLYDKSKDQLKPGGTLYIATDERKKEFFNVLKDHYDVTFMDDYMHLIKGVNPNYYGMLDQLVAYKGRVFFGTWFSTLSGYVNRMRGYYSQKNKLQGYELGQLKSFYFVPEDKKNQMSKYMAVKLPIYMREFPTSWRDIDKGIDELK